MVILLLFPGIVRAQLSPVERRGLIEALYLGNLTEDDLKSVRRPATFEPLSLPLVNLAVDDPIEAANRLLAIHQSGHGSLAQALRTACGSGFGDPTDLKTSVPHPLPVPDSVPLRLRPAVSQLAADLEEANSTVRVALSKLTESEKRDVIETLPRWANPVPGFTPDFAKRPPISQASLLALLGKVDLPAIRFAARKLATGIEAELPELRNHREALKTGMTFTVHGVVVELSGTANDIHSARNVNLCIDFGGDNTYTGRYGAGVGYASVLIDFGRHDWIQGPDSNAGSGILGIGLAYFAGEGDCIFQGGALSFGSGFGGVGGLSKHGGNDRYSATTLSQGAAAFGIGILLDSGGNDQYSVDQAGQGFARTGGLAWLDDQEGNDVYRADSGQGFGGGVKTADGIISGGIGLLTDLSGDDTYLGGTRCQASGDSGGLGSLYDASGKDTYSATDEAQGSAQHLAAAYFFDLAGDDSYAIHGGVGHATAVDWSVAFFLDRSGNDLYNSLDARPGTAIKGGLAVFLDAAGNDRYMGDVAIGFPTRGPGSLGLFADLGGSDGYGFSENFEGQATVQPGRKIAYDAPTPADNLSLTPPPDHKFPKPGTQAFSSPEEIEQLYEASVLQGTATEALDKLVAIGQPAFDWLTLHKLSATDELRNRPFLALITALGKSALIQLASKIDDPDDAIARGALSICLEGDFEETVPHLSSALRRPALQETAIVAIGRLGAKDLSKDLAGLCSNPDRRIAVLSLTALRELNAGDGVSLAQGLVGSTDMLVRDAAIDYLTKFPQSAMSTARGSLASPDERIQRIGIEILSKVGSTEALGAIAPYLTTGTMGLKIQALISLDGRCPTTARQAYLALREDVNSLIKAVALHTDPGR